MKKILSILLMLTFIVSTVPVMAEYENIDCTEAYTAGVIPASVVIETKDEAGNVTQEAETYTNGTVYTRKVTAAYNSTGEAAFIQTKNSMYGVKTGSYAMVYKVTLPPLAQNQQYDQLWFNWTSSTVSTAADTLIKYPGENWDLLSLNSKSESILAALNASDPASDGDKIILDSANGAYKRCRADVTAYANECRMLGQTYMYIGLTNASTKKVFGTQGYTGNKEDTAAISFVAGPFSGLLTTTSTLEWTDVSALNVAGTTYTNPLEAMTAIRYDTSAYALYRLPMPKLSSTQTIVDYKLYIGIHGNSMGTGYNTYNIYKVDDGADYFANEWTLGEHPFGTETVENHRMYNNKVTMTYSADDATYEFACARLTSYAKELAAKDTVPENMYVALVTAVGSTVTLKGNGQAAKYRPYVEYTIFDSNGVAEGYEVNDLKIVLSSSDRYQTENVTTLTAGTTYRAVMKASNVETVSKDTTLYIATYIGGELDSLTTVPCAIDALSTDYFVWSDAFTPSDAGATVKVFLWDGNTENPLTVSKTANVVAAE